jgi:hypothetical protein
MSHPKPADCRALVTEIARAEVSELSGTLTTQITRAGKMDIGDNGPDRS